MQTNPSILFYSWRAVLKMFVRLYHIKASEILEKRRKSEETGTKSALDYFKMPELQEIFTTAAILFNRYERLAVLQNVFAFILL